MQLRNLEIVGVLAVTALLSGCSTIGRPVPIPGLVSDNDDPDADVRDFRIGALTAKVRLRTPGVERDYFSGILASRSARTEESLQLLNRALPELRKTQPQRAAIALKAVAESYFASYRYREAAQAYDDLEQHFDEGLRRGVGSDAAVARLLRDVSPQTVEWTGPVHLPTSRNPIGSLVSEIAIDGVSEQWLLDTGANQSVVSRSYAQRLGLVPLNGVASVGAGLTGLSSSLQAAVIPQLPIGGATMRNVIVLNDANLRIGTGPEAYQIHAILGYPVLKGLGQVTFTRDGEFLAGQTRGGTVTVPMFMRGLTPAIECEVEGQRLPFTLDTGASSSDFSVRYYERFAVGATNWSRRTIESGGAGGTVTQDVFTQPAVNMKIGDASVVLQNVSIVQTRMNAGLDVLFGNLGQDFADAFKSFTLDFVNMTFSVETWTCDPQILVRITIRRDFAIE
jgi:predicted aspartyl protease